MGTLCHLARPERFELPTAWFVARYSIQLSYGRIVWYRAQGALLQRETLAGASIILVWRAKVKRLPGSGFTTFAGV